MTRPTLSHLFLLLMAADFAIAQQPADQAFVVASVKRDVQFKRPVLREDDRGITFIYASLKRILMEAYEAKVYQLAGPSWLDSEFYDIEADAPEGSSLSQMHGMLRTLLEERFGASVHWETRQMRGYALRVATGGPKFKECSLDNCPREGFLIQPTGTFLRFQAKTTGKLADELAGVLKEPVIDMTGLAGTWSIQVNARTLEADANETRAPDRITLGGQTIDIPESTPSIFDAMKEIGLRLVNQQLAIKILVVDRIERIPTEN